MKKLHIIELAFIITVLFFNYSFVSCLIPMVTFLLLIENDGFNESLPGEGRLAATGPGHTEPDNSEKYV